MRLSKKWSKLVLLLYISIFLFSCGNNLSRGKAEDLVVKKYQLPEIKTVNLNKRYIKKSWGDASWIPAACYVYDIGESEGSRLNELMAKGLVTTNESNEHQGQCNYIWTNVVLTDEGKKYLASETAGQYQLKAYEVAFGEITGIQTQEQFKVAEVSYTLQKKNFTPFAHDYDSQNRAEGGSASFSLFDDGWRIN